MCSHAVRRVCGSAERLATTDRVIRSTPTAAYVDLDRERDRVAVVVMLSNRPHHGRVSSFKRIRRRRQSVA
jgi:hypothetical protein